MKRNSIEFKKKNLISSRDVPFRKVIVEYLYWTLAGKPNKHTIQLENDNVNQ